LSQECRSHRQHPILARLVTTIPTTLDTVAAVVHRLWQGVGRLTDIGMLLDPTQTLALSGAGLAAFIYPHRRPGYLPVARLEESLGHSARRGGIIRG
jgi:hypothetical protein